METLINYLATNEWLTGLVVIILAYLLIKRYARGQARSIAIKHLAVAEKTVLDSADNKIAFASDAAYAVLPRSVRLLLPKNVFNVLVQECYNELKTIFDNTK